MKLDVGAVIVILLIGTFVVIAILQTDSVNKACKNAGYEGQHPSSYTKTTCLGCANCFVQCNFLQTKCWVENGSD